MFGTSGVRGPIGEDVTAALALAVGRALASEGTQRVVVGRDPRESGEVLRDALVAGLRECGADVIDLGQAATPTIARSVSWYTADAGVSITASHNPAPDNGLKLWNPSGQAFDTEQRAAIAERIETEDFDLKPWDELGTAQSDTTAQTRHVDALTAKQNSLNGLSVTVDVGNGAGQVTADSLYELGCDVETLNAQPDGRFPARPSEPTAENCKRLCQHVAATDTDLGIAHDGDADRMRAVDETGEFLSGDALLALFGIHEATEGTRIAAPVDTSLAVDDALADCGASVTRTRVGDVFVAEEVTNSDVVFGGEPSGAWIWPDETLCPDGSLAAVKLAALVADRGPLSELVDSIEQYPIRRDNVDVDDKTEVMNAIRNHVLEEYDNVSTIDGVRIEMGTGWILIRASGTQPLIRLTAEARNSKHADTLLTEARTLLQRFC
ncbi:phosphoglucosamine mutase [Halogranum gelatinilyticum]|uniref:Phosphoglucosamine mutase n=1 Tax=Halogranum gelatinilyticum TaxID=660521 RepID=A0A1G9X8F8_9EURY|nr:phosphoglucosamine mutase [Halogranum gelatinilyticum]SDM92781.1 phosphoglucosamine mutase [Halogranum gelatinilyticum]